MNKGVKIIFIFIILVLLIIVFFFYFNKKNDDSNIDRNENYPPVALFPIPDQNSERMTLQKKNQPLEVNNLYKNPIERLGENVLVFGKSPNFESLFHPQDQGFVITLLGDNLRMSREEAEKDLLEKLGVSQEKACGLRVNLAVPAFVNNDVSGINYGLSFCPEGIPLPQK